MAVAAEVSQRIEEAFAKGIPVDQALSRAVREAIGEHARAGLPLAVWKGGRVVWIHAETSDPTEEGDSPTRTSLKSG